MSYYYDRRDKAVRTRDEIFKDPGGGVFHWFDKKTGKIIEKELPWVLKNRYLNLLERIKDDAIAYFEKNDIEWHKDAAEEPKKGPEGHLLSSNIACINHLFFLRQCPDLVTLILKNIDPRIINAERIDDGYIEFEKMGGIEQNPLGEVNDGNGRKRGYKSTSIDALMVGKKDNGKNILLLIEWKYTEKGEKSYRPSQNHSVYKKLLRNENCPINLPENIDKLLCEPYYQPMRQTLLGWKMVELKEYDSDEYIHLHIIPRDNIEMRKNLVWDNLLKSQYQKRYKVISPDDLFNPLINLQDIKSYIEYLKFRYW